MNLNIIFPVASGILVALGNFFVKSGMNQVTSFSISKLLFNSTLMLGLGLGVIGGILMFYSLKILPLWLVILTFNTITTVGAVVLGVLVLKEFISSAKSILTILIISLLIALMAIK